MTDPLITDAFEDLAHALRILLESNIRAHAGGLLQLDRDEAIGNIEGALTTVLNAFHSLYDAMEKGITSKRIDWYAAPELATVLALRNARHHNQAKKIRTMYNYYVQEVEAVGRMERYLLVDFLALEPGAKTFDLYLSWQDLQVLFAMPRKETRLREDVESSIRAYIGTGKFGSYATKYELSQDRVFFNCVPLLVNAAIKVVPLIMDAVSPRSMESETYLKHFCGLAKGSDTTQHEVNCGPVAF